MGTSVSALNRKKNKSKNTKKKNDTNVSTEEATKPVVLGTLICLYKTLACSFSLNEHSRQEDNGINSLGGFC